MDTWNQSEEYSNTGDLRGRVKGAGTEAFDSHCRDIRHELGSIWREMMNAHEGQGVSNWMNNLRRESTDGLVAFTSGGQGPMPNCDLTGGSTEWNWWLSQVKGRGPW